MIDVKIFNSSPNNPNPDYATQGSSGMDLRANISEPIKLSSLKRAMVPTGIHIELPEDTEAQVRPRSGLAAKQGLTVLNTPGTVDEDYRGEIKVILVNISSEEVTINPGDRIAQLVFAKVEKAKLESVASIQGLSTTQRGTGGFGSTGIK
jgi:dUTP pyrophosphatase